MYNGPVWSLRFSGLNVACSPALGCECYRRAAAYGARTIPTPRRTALGDKTGTIDRKCILFHGFPPASPFPGPYQRTNAFEKHGKQSTGRHCCPHFDRSNLAYPSAYIWSLSGPHPASRRVEIQMLSHLYVLRGFYSEQIYRTSASVLSCCLARSPLSRSSTATLTPFHTDTPFLRLFVYYTVFQLLWKYMHCVYVSYVLILILSNVYMTYTVISYEVRGNILLILFLCFMYTLLHKIYILFTL